MSRCETCKYWGREQPVKTDWSCGACQYFDGRDRPEWIPREKLTAAADGESCLVYERKQEESKTCR